MIDRNIWIVEEHEPESQYPVCVLGAYASFEAAEEAVKVHRAANLAEMAAGQRAERDETELWWEIEPVNFEDNAPGERQAAAGAPSPEPQEQAAAPVAAQAGLPDPVGFRFWCPQCKKTEYIDVSATIWVRITENSLDNVQTDADESMDGSHNWDDDAAATCCNCGFSGTVNDFDHDEVSEAMRDLVAAGIARKVTPEEMWWDAERLRGIRAFVLNKEEVK